MKAVDPARYVNYVSERTTADGHRHWSVNIYDNVLQWVTYLDDFKFNPTKDKVHYIKGVAYNS